MKPKLHGRLDPRRGYFSTRTNDKGVKVHTLIYLGQPLCADNEDFEVVRRLAREEFGPINLPLWDGDQGQFVAGINAY
jgi:hypothetical protein